MVNGNVHDRVLVVYNGALLICQKVTVTAYPINSSLDDSMFAVPIQELIDTHNCVAELHESQPIDTSETDTREENLRINHNLQRKYQTKATLINLHG